MPVFGDKILEYDYYSDPTFETDFCSVPGWLGLFPYFRKYSELFRPACIHHDWMYHTACKEGIPKEHADVKFHFDMIQIALDLEDQEDRFQAIKAAGVYYAGVRLGGAKGYREAARMCGITHGHN